MLTLEVYIIGAVLLGALGMLARWGSGATPRQTLLGLLFGIFWPALIPSLILLVFAHFVGAVITNNWDWEG